MVLDEYILENTKIKFYDDYVVKDISTQKKYIDTILFNLLCKIDDSHL